MGKYAALTDIKDTVAGVIADDLTAADNEIDALLRERGIDPDELTLPDGNLKDLAIYYGCSLACTRKATGAGESLFPGKAKLYWALWDEKSKRITRKSLGLAASSTGYSTITLGRG